MCVCVCGGEMPHNVISSDCVEITQERIDIKFNQLLIDSLVCFWLYLVPIRDRILAYIYCVWEVIRSVHPLGATLMPARWHSTSERVLHHTNTYMCSCDYIQMYSIPRLAPLVAFRSLPLPPPTPTPTYVVPHCKMH